MCVCERGRERERERERENMNRIFPYQSSKSVEGRSGYPQNGVLPEKVAKLFTLYIRPS